MKQLRGGFLLLALAVGSMLPLAAQADVWGYVDENGMTHFAEKKLDARYQLYFKTESFKFDPRKATVMASSGRGARSAGAVGLVYNPRADSAAGTKAQRLVALINQSGAYRNVSKHMQREAARTGVDFELIKAVAAAESGFNSSAVSSAGAVGLMQIMPATARDMGVQSDERYTVEQKLTDPSLNVKLGTRYLKFLMNKFPGRLDLAVAAYNAGHGAVQRAGYAVPRYTETQNYVRTVLAIYQTLKPGAAGATAYAGVTPIPLARNPKSNGRVSMTLAGSRAKTPPAVPNPVVLTSHQTPQTVALAKDVADKAEAPSAMDTVASKVTVAEAAPVPANIVGDDVVIKDPTDLTPPIH